MFKKFFIKKIFILFKLVIFHYTFLHNKAQYALPLDLSSDLLDVRYVRLYTILAWLRVHCVINAFGHQILPIFGHLQLKLNSLHVYIYIFYKWHIVTYTWSLGLVDSRLVKKNKKWINILLIIFVMRFGLTVSYLFFEIYISCTCISYRIRRCLCCRPLL